MAKIQDSAVPTTKDVARLAGVSPATVSYVINGHRKGSPTITEATRQRVLAAMAELNYVPNLAGRNLRRLQTERVCLALTDLGRPYDNRLAEDILRKSQEKGYSFIVAMEGEAKLKEPILKQLQSRMADGAVIKLEDINQIELEDLVKAQIAVVVFNNQLAPQNFDVVRTNEAEAARVAVRYLIDKGHRRIGFIGHHFIDSPFEVRYLTYKSTLQEYGIALNKDLIVTGADKREEAYLSTKGLIALENPPTAIFCASDIAAISAIWAIRDANLRIPEDIAVIGSGNIPESKYTSPPLTTIGLVSLDFTEVANLLFSRLENPALPGRELCLPWELILRGSA
ncbi:MAG TPA: LacI family DNA-binding transcriptional regulator [Chloroflexia bacterium]|nr:LacI family DNA-binding transcriptional regulator [Chloroflexia bacterium]